MAGPCRGPGAGVQEQSSYGKWHWPDGSDGSTQSTAVLSSAILICEDLEGRRVAYPQLVQRIGRSSALPCGVREAAQSSS